MALKPQAITPPDTITFKDATAKLQAMAALGIPVGGLSEELAINGELDYIDVTNAELWEDDGKPGIYYAKIWGKFVDVRRTCDILNDKTKTPINRLLSIASIAFESDAAALTEAQAFSAIDGLDPVAKAINAALAAVCPV